MIDNTRAGREIETEERTATGTGTETGRGTGMATETETGIEGEIETGGDGLGLGRRRGLAGERRGAEVVVEAGTCTKSCLSLILMTFNLNTE